MRKPLALICSIALVPALAACGSDGDEESGDKGGAGGAVPTEQAPEPGSVGGREEAQATVEVKMQDVEFAPKNATVKKGGTVRWTNEEAVPHDVTKKSGPGKNFSSGNGDMNKGDTYEQSFPAAGKIDYICTVHPKMVGTITVR
jgi:plastocyanin